MSAELTVKQAIEARRSIRTYSDEAIPDATLQEILRLAGLAPSPWNLQPWRVYAIKDQATKDKLKEAAFGQKQVGTNAVLIVITTDMKDTLHTAVETVHPGYGDAREETAKGVVEIMAGLPEGDLDWWGKAQGYSYMSFLLLAAQSHGFSSSAMLGFDPGAVRAVLGLGDHVQVPALVALGVAAEEGFTHFRHPLERVVKVI